MGCHRLGRGSSPRLSTRPRLYKCEPSPNPSHHDQLTSAPRARPTVVPLLLLPPATPSCSPRTWLTGEQVSKTPPLRILYGRAAIRFLGSDYATALLHVRVVLVITMSTDTEHAPPRNLKPTRRPLRTPLPPPPPPRLLTGPSKGITCLSRSCLLLS
jgi:hypothetical protein